MSERTLSTLFIDREQELQDFQRGDAKLSQRALFFREIL
ncbi:hypothetical protein U27_06623 [Candidatus Vecturithrix granuli]|uniref:Uncharacterized protein n=1 Tax=Vecturithrix granuli TaxID=1499967 RepID=A0A081C4Y3_VECG1|nr:hypothetical protein U27_06623 [Candidatus Vecturithrix granuli]